MKYIVFILAGATSIIYAQNPFTEGINKSGIIELNDTESESSVYDAKITMNDNCSATYQFTQHWTDKVVEKTNSHVLKWFWKDITYIRVDKVLNVLELDTDRKVNESTTDTKTNETINNNQEFDIAIYYKNIDDVLKAADWVVTKVSGCGGTAVYLK